MTYEQWIKLYKEAMELLSIIDNTCTFINDNYVSCNSCKIHNKCNYVVPICYLQPK